jgi:hypothetical protein
MPILRFRNQLFAGTFLKNKHWNNDIATRKDVTSHVFNKFVLYLYCYWYCCYGARLSVELRPLRGPLSIPQMIHEWIMEQRWNGMKSEENLSQCHFVCHKSHWTDLGANPGRSGERPLTAWVWHGHLVFVSRAYLKIWLIIYIHLQETPHFLKLLRC